MSGTKLDVKFESIKILSKITKFKNHTKNKHIIKEVMCNKSGPKRVQNYF